MDITRVSSVWGNLPPCGAAGERSEFNIKSPLGAPLLIFPRDYLLKSFPRVDTSARQRGFEIRVFHLLGELPKAIEPHLPVCQLYRWQLGPSMWTSPTTKSLDPIVVTALRVGFPRESHGPATCGLPAIVRSQRRGQRRCEGQILNNIMLSGVLFLATSLLSYFGHSFSAEKTILQTTIAVCLPL